jgi:oxygen-independent coproporphyrinogen-3 oxidase
MRRLLAGIKKCLPITQTEAGEMVSRGNELVEFTVEANPESLDEDFLSVCREGGVNRISVGVQSFYKPSRAAVHRAAALSCVEIEKQLALVSRMYPGAFSVDLISGLPLQTREVLRGDIDRVLSFNPGHVSLYALTVEKGTPLALALERNPAAVTLPEPDEADSLWLSGAEHLVQAGYNQYEVSNFALNGNRSVHNIRYWRMENWLAAGPGASATIIDDERGTARRYTVPADVALWLAGSPMQEEFLDTGIVMKETLLMGFRYCEGPDAALFHRRFGEDIGDFIPKTLKKWRDRGLMAENGGALNREGLRMLDRFLIDAFMEIEAKPAFPTTAGNTDSPDV